MRHRFLLPMMLAPTLAGLTACGDDITDLDGMMDSAEAEAVLRSAEALPLLPVFMDAARAETTREAAGSETASPYGAHAAMLLRARELWDAGTAQEGPRGAARRRLAIGYAVPALLETVPPDEWSLARERIDDWMITAGSMLQHLSLPEVEAQLEAAGRQLRRSDEAVTERERAYHLLLAGSELVETTPRYVARALTREAAVVVEAAAGKTAAPVPAATLERARRLRAWAVQALEEGQYLLAIQRSYYAMQLLEGP